MKDQLHYEECIRKGLLPIRGGGNEAIVSHRICDDPVKRVMKGQLELYKYFKQKYECGEKPHESEIFEIYSKYVTTPERWRATGNPEVDEDRVRYNARNWFKRAIAALVMEGFFTLNFK